MRADLTEVLLDTVHDAWFQELKSAATDDGAAAIDARWTPEIVKAKAEAWALVDDLSPERVRARIDREQQSAHAAGVYRATGLARRAFGGEHG